MTQSRIEYRYDRKSVQYRLTATRYSVLMSRSINMRTVPIVRSTFLSRYGEDLAAPHLEDHPRYVADRILLKEWFWDSVRLHLTRTATQIGVLADAIRLEYTSAPEGSPENVRLDDLAALLSAVLTPIHDGSYLTVQAPLVPRTTIVDSLSDRVAKNYTAVRNLLLATHPIFRIIETHNPWAVIEQAIAQAPAQRRDALAALVRDAAGGITRASQQLNHWLAGDGHKHYRFRAVFESVIATMSALAKEDDFDRSDYTPDIVRELIREDIGRPAQDYIDAALIILPVVTMPLSFGAGWPVAAAVRVAALAEVTLSLASPVLEIIERADFAAVEPAALVEPALNVAPAFGDPELDLALQCVMLVALQGLAVAARSVSMRVGRAAARARLRNAAGEMLADWKEVHPDIPKSKSTITGEAERLGNTGSAAHARGTAPPNKSNASRLGTASPRAAPPPSEPRLEPPAANASRRRASGAGRSVSPAAVARARTVLIRRVSDIDILRRLWQEAVAAAAKPIDLSTYEKARYAYKLAHARFWRHVKKSEEAKRLFLDAGFVFDEPAPTFPGLPGRFGKVSLDHTLPVREAHWLALDPEHLELVVSGDNTILEVIRVKLKSGEIPAWPTLPLREQLVSDMGATPEALAAIERAVEAEIRAMGP